MKIQELNAAILLKNDELAENDRNLDLLQNRGWSEKKLGKSKLELLNNGPKIRKDVEKLREMAAKEIDKLLTSPDNLGRKT